MKRHKKRKVIVGMVVVFAVAGVIAAVSVRGKGKQTEVEAKQSTIALGKMDLVKSISATGTIESKKAKAVTSSVKDTTVGKVLVSVGDSVKKGDSLVTFEKSALQEALEEAKENLSDARSDANREISNARKQLNSAIETKNEEKSRQTSNISAAKKEKQAAQKAVTKAKKKVSSAKDAQQKTAAQEALSKAQEALKQAETAYNNAVENQSSSSRQNETSVENARSALENAQANGNKSIKEATKQVTAAEESLKDCSVKAPISGVVTAVHVEEGDSYSGGDLLQIDDVSSFIVSTTVDEYDISDVAVGQKVVVLTEATDEDELEGEITFVAPSKATSSTTAQAGDAGSAASTSTSDGYAVTIAIKTEDERLKLGMTAKCSIVLEEAKDVFAVPYDAVHEKPDGAYINYESEDSVTKAAVTKGMESDYYVEISGNDLYEGMKIVIPTDKTEKSSDDDASSKNNLGFPGGAGGGNRDGMGKGDGNQGGMGAPQGGGNQGGMGAPQGGGRP